MNRPPSFASSRQRIEAFLCDLLRNRLVVGWVLAGFFALIHVVSPAVAQSVIDTQSAWSNVDPGSVYTTNVTGDTGNGNKFVATSGGTASAVVVGLSGAANDDGDAAADTFNFVLRSLQTFKLDEQALVTIPTYLFGAINFPAGIQGIGSVTGRVEVFDSTPAATGLVATRNFNGTQPGGNVAVNTFDIPSMVLAADTYTILATLTLTGNSNPTLMGAAGSQVNSNFISTAQHGLVTSFSAVPQGLGDSRSTINAPTARATYNVDGTGIKVGQIEPGEPYTNHTSLAGAGKLTIRSGGVALPAGVTDRQDEHALAVATIIAADTANNSTSGVAPKAQLVSAGTSSFAGATASARFRAAFDDVLGQGVRVMSMSATTFENTDNAFVDQRITANPNLLFIKSTGNDEPQGVNSVTPPGLAYNGIAVGALNRTFEKRADFSNYSHSGLPIKPDIVAPGEYILAANSRDTDGAGGVNDFSRGFLGDDYHRLGATTGDITGTSFAAPHVAGAGALLHHYQATHAATHDADHRVMKAVLLNSASTNVKHSNGAAWAQSTTGSINSGNLFVIRSLDDELGAGKLNVNEALRQYSSKEALATDTNSARNFMISPPDESRIFWDLERVGAASGGINGTVDYLLGNIDGIHLRTTLTWDSPDGAALVPLELRLYHEGGDDGNPLGFDPLNPTADDLLAQTSGNAENVKLFDFLVPTLGPSENPGYYLQVFNLSQTLTTFALVMVPEPNSLALSGIAFIAVVFLGRKRGR